MPIQANLVAHGNFPELPVYKAFSDISHVESFIEHGVFRMGALSSYRLMEDAGRQDRLEGQGHIQVPGLVQVANWDAQDRSFFEMTEEPGLRQVHTELGNPIYIFSTSLTGVDFRLMAERFGKFIVRIDDPRQLALDITEHLKVRSEKFAGGIEGRLISYNRGQVVEEALDHYERTALSYSQKSVNYRDDCEFRFIAINMDRHSQRTYEEYIEVNLCSPISYAKLLELPASNQSVQTDGQQAGRR